MKNLLLATGAAYGVYMLLRRFNTAHKFALVESDYDEAPVGSGFLKNKAETKKNKHGNIRQLLNKASVKAHHLL